MSYAMQYLNEMGMERGKPGLTPKFRALLDAYVSSPPGMPDRNNPAYALLCDYAERYSHRIFKMLNKEVDGQTGYDVRSTLIEKEESLSPEEEKQLNSLDRLAVASDVRSVIMRARLERIYDKCGLERPSA